ncbi:uncharacterized protein LOC123319826 [Coccinella septempunctata]|uniref:uncharacterized protein LOC123319826 n=1 Tax=Coccinella septempunctata TaxID=41139 RepID=UPI001D05EC0E|nr:uncharacterized protein LOC123319826 [Coccinella septempunctata]
MFIFEKIDTVPFWKKIYQTASGYSPSVTSDIVEEILKVSSTELKGAYSIYKSYTEEGFQKWEKGITEEDTDLIVFIKRLCKSLNLEPMVALPIFFNYLMFEYYGKIDDIKNLILYEHSVLSLLENIWHFYTSERMYYVKTLKHIFESALNRKSPFKDEYVKFIGTLNITEFRKTLITQLKSLINEITEESLENSFDKSIYVNRNNREQLEFILLIIMTMEYKEISVAEFSDLCNCFFLHNFTRQPVYFDTTLYGDPADFNDVKTAEIGSFIISIHQLSDKINGLSKDIEMSLKNIQNQGNHKIVLLSWVFGKLKALKEEDMESANIYENLLRILIEGQTFMSIYEFLSTKLMRSEVRSAKLIQAAFFKLLDELLVAMENKENLVKNEGLIYSLCRLMEDPDIAAECTTVKGGLDIVVMAQFIDFPSSYRPLTRLCKVMVKHRDLQEVVLAKLNRLHLEHRESYNDHKPLNYFQFLYSMVKEIGVKGGGLSDEFLKDILMGYELIHEIVKHYKGDVNECGFLDCLSVLDKLVDVYSSQQAYTGFMKIYFKIQTAMVLHQGCKVQVRFQGFRTTKQFLPKLLTQERIPEALMQRHIIDSSLLPILRKEEYEEDHSTIETYLRLILHCVRENLDLETVQIPGVVYMTTFIFPFHKNWQYGDPQEHVEISVLCLRIILEVLNRRKVQDEDVLKRFVFYSLLKCPPMMTVFLQYLVQEKFHLQRVMMNEVDWINGKTLDNITLSKLHLSIFLRLLSECNLKPSDPVLRPNIQTVTKCAASFITNAFSSSLANLACRLLEKLSRDPDIPILAVLEMDYTQIQCLFLEKLRDPLEDDIFKITALDFVNTSLLTQNGLTAAFFNATDSLDEKKSVTGDSVCDFMIDYLQNIQKSPDYLTNPVQKSILRVFSTLWSTGRENLVKDIYSLKSFWPLLTDPLFHPRIKDPEVYTHIMTIATIHIMEFQKNVDKNLKQVLTDFFKNETLIKEWIGYIKSVLNTYIDDDQYKEASKFILAWKKLVISIKTYIPEVITSDSVKCNLIHSCLKGIIWNFSIMLNNDILTDFSDLFLILIFTWPDSYKSEIETVDLLTTVLHTYVSNCKFPSCHNREVFLTIAHKTIKDCCELLQSNPSLLNNLLKSIGLMLDSEYNNLCSNHEDLTSKIRSIMCWVLVARVGDSVLCLKTVKPFSTFFKYHQYLTKMLDSIRLLLNDVHTLPMVKMLLKTLIHYAESDIAMDFLTENYTVIYDIIENGKSIFPNSSKEELPVNLKELWILYAMVIKLNHILLNKFGEKVTESNFTFLSVYDRVISQMICLPEYTVDNRALDLSCETLLFVDKMLDWAEVWSIKSMGSFTLIVTSIKRVLNCCISSVLRPENIHFYKINKLGKLNFVYESANHLIAKVVNRLLELSCLAFRCLIKCNPSMDQLFSVEKPKCATYLLVEYDFTIPKFDVPIGEDLTYGRLLCMIYFLCKTLNKEFSKTPTADSPSVRSKEIFNTEITKEKSLGEIFGKFTLFDEDYIGFIEYPRSSNHILQPVKLSAFLHYGEQVNSEPWIKDISKEKVQTTLEYLMSFLAVQVFYHIYTLQKPQLHYFKRELYSELQFFNEYAKKLATEEYNKQSSKRRSEPQNTDVINRLLIELLDNNKLKDVEKASDKFFLLGISKWFMNICQLS